jgi:hypothetical protein
MGLHVYIYTDLDRSTHYPQRDLAERAADCCNRDDPDWTYQVVQCGAYWAIEVLDQDGLTLGFL